jgi:Protein of unknown function (DUF2778)
MVKGRVLTIQNLTAAQRDDLEAMQQAGGASVQVIPQGGNLFTIVATYPDTSDPPPQPLLSPPPQAPGQQPPPTQPPTGPGWIYAQKTGNMFHVENGAPVLRASGYSGNGADENNPAAQFVQLHGPIPQGWYTIGPPQQFKNMMNCLPLTPDPANNMGGRSGFLIHDGAFNNPLGHGMTSEGCICLPQIRRVEIWDSGDRRLQVVANLPVSS